MSKFEKIKSFLIKYISIFLGFIFFTLYFWNSFLRQRLSKDLPLHLDIIYLIILISTCLTFIYIIFSIIFPRKNNVIIEDLVELFFIPLKEFDKFIKTTPFIESYYQKIMVYLIEYFEKFIINSHKYFYIFWLFPRIILLFAFIVDIFIFHKFHYKYFFILFGLLLFFSKYFIYSIKCYKQELLTYYSNYIFTVNTPYVSGVHPSEFEEDYDPDDDDLFIDESMELPLEIFLDFQAKSIVYENNKRNIIHITSTPLLHQEYWIDYIGHSDPMFFNKPVPEGYKNVFGDKVPDNYNDAVKFVYEKSDNFLKENVESLTRISVMIEYYKKTSYQDFNIKAIKIIVYVIYLICWLYVLYISAKIYFPSINDVILVGNIFGSFQHGFNPFSDSQVIEYVVYEHRLVLYDYILFFINNNYHIKWIGFFKPLIKLLIAYSIMYKYYFSKNKNS